MRRRIGRKKRGKKNSATAEDLHSSVAVKPKGIKAAQKNMSAYYKSGPMVAMPHVNDAAGRKAANPMLVPSTLPAVSGSGAAKQNHAKANSVSLSGRTDATFDGGSYSTENVRVTTADGCAGCGDSDPCIRARGTLVARYRVTTTVTLPSVDDFPELTECQIPRVQNAIDTVLAPHEQEHVQAFGQYNGVVRTPFDTVICRSEFASTIQDMFDAQESARHASAQAASDALDPFNFTVDIDCEEPPEEDTSAVEEEAPVEEVKPPGEEHESEVEGSDAPTDESETEPSEKENSLTTF